MKDKLTVVCRIYHQQEKTNPTLSEFNFTRRPENSDQPWQRMNQLVGQEWIPLIDKRCWIEEAGLILVLNHETERYDKIPDKDVLENDQKKVIEIAGDRDNPLLVLPGEGFSFSPKRMQNLSIRCQHEQARYTITVFPK